MRLGWCVKNRVGVGHFIEQFLSEGWLLVAMTKKEKGVGRNDGGQTLGEFVTEKSSRTRWLRGRQDWLGGRSTRCRRKRFKSYRD